MLRTLAVIGVLVAVLGGCGRGEDPAKPLRTFEPQNTASSPSPKPRDADPLACKLLTSKERRSIAGQKLDVVTPITPTKGIHECRWVDSLASPLPNSVAIVAQSAQEWLRTVPRRIDVLVRSGAFKGKMLKRLQNAKKDVLRGADKIDDVEACGIFSLLIEARFDKKGLKQFYVLQDANTASVTRCANGVHTSVSYSERGLTSSFALSEALQRLTRLAHKRAVRLL